MKVFWYAPFNNGTEMELAHAVRRPEDHFVYQSLSSRRGVKFDDSHVPFRMVRDLPDTPGDDGGPATRWRRARVTVSRVARRQRLLRSERFDVAHIHTYNPFVDPLALRLVRSAVDVLVVSVHNVRPHSQRFLLPTIETRTLKLGYNVADRVIVSHDVLRDQMVNEFGLDAGKVSVVPLPTPEVVGGRPTGDGDPSTFLFFGTLRSNKGIDVLLEAMRSMARENIRLVIAGQGDARLENQVRAAARADDRIRAEIGYIHPLRVDELFRTCGTVVLPYTTFSAQSGVLRDAYAYGRPVIATNVGALGADVAQHSTGLVVDPGDALELASAMRQLMSRSPLRSTLQEAATQVGDSRSFAEIGKAIRSLYPAPGP